MVPAGALGAIDALAAARLGGLTSVEQSLAKPPRAWRGTPAEALLDLDGLTQATPFFNGTARDAASQYPQNANVAATVAAAGVGFDESKVELVADPALNGPVHRIKVQGAFGNMELVLSGVTLPDNPKTSMLAALSIARALINTSDIIVV
jgi:aspartate dehydrogenase